MCRQNIFSFTQQNLKKCLEHDELNNEIKIKQDMFTPPKIMGDQIITS
jgi:hypothetical protein